MSYRLTAHDFSGMPNLKRLVIGGDGRSADKKISLDEDVLSELQHLELIAIYRTSLPKLTKKMFSVCTMGQMELGSNNIAEIEPGTFAFCSNVTKLGLEGNAISQWNKNMFSGLEQVTDLDISVQVKEIAEYPVDLLSSMPNLVFVRLGGATLQKVPDGFFSKQRKLGGIEFTPSPLTLTSKSAFQGMPLPDGLPETFGVEDLSTQDWGM
jgi:hypothetical protein